MEPKIYYNNVKFRLKKTGEIKNWIKKVIRSEGKEPGDLSFIFADEENMLKMNIKYLGHDYNTDVITFDYSKDDFIEGEIYIGIDTIRKNAKKYKVTLRNEVKRVMVHGVLHMLGYEDKNEEQRKLMKEREDYHIGEIK